MKRKQDKASEKAKTVRMDLRRLASLFIAFKKVPGAEQCHGTDASSMLALQCAGGSDQRQMCRL